MIDEGVVGMREGGWRRLIVPDAYGDDGLRKRNPLRGGASYTPPKAGFVVKPHAFAWVELIMVDGGSGRCIERLPEPGRLRAPNKVILPMVRVRTAKTGRD